jgi:tetratricopeptide (TPR) repeat protein
VATVTCLEENDVLALLQAGEQAAPELRDHAARCERCRSLVATVTRVVFPNERSEPSGWPDGSELLRPGTVLGAYEIGERIGEGGMGIVYAARDTRLRRKVALKLLRPDVGPSLDRLRHEARITASLSHPNVVAVYDVRDSPYGVCVAMEFVDGQDLACWSTHRHTLTETLAVLRQAGAGLAAAHRAGIVHRDFKPHNVLIGADGRARVVDFGLAVSRAVPEDDFGRAIVGTPAFIAPEQIRGEPVDARADQFSFCVVAFVALTGERPFRGRNLSMLLAEIEAGRIARAPGMPAFVRAAIERGLAADPADRFATLDELLAAMDRKPRRVWWVAAAGVAVALAFVAAPRASPPVANETELAPLDDDRLVQRYEAIHAEVAASRSAGAWERDRERFVEHTSQLRAEAVAAGDDRTVARAELLLGTFARWDARHDDAKVWFESAFMAAERAEDRGSAFEAARTLWTLADVVDADAEAMARWRAAAQRAAEQTGDPADRVRFVVADVKADSFAATDYAAAVRRLDEAEALLGEDASALAREEVLSTRGFCRVKAGDAAGAIADFQRALDLLTQEHGPDSIELGYTLNGMAVAQTQLGQLEAAARSLEHLARLMQPNPNNPDTAAVRGNLAQIYVELKDYERALAEFQAVREAFQAFHGLRHPDVGRTTVAIASTLYQLGRHEEARREAEEAQRWGAPPEHRVQLQLLWASATAKLGDVEAARPALRAVLADPEATERDRTEAQAVLDGLD